MSEIKRNVRVKVGFIGFGNVGGKLLGLLLCNGIDLMVYDLNLDLVDVFVVKGVKRVEGFV